MLQQSERVQPKPLGKKFFIALGAITSGFFIVLVSTIFIMNKLISNVPADKFAENLKLLEYGEIMNNTMAIQKLAKHYNSNQSDCDRSELVLRKYITLAHHDKYSKEDKDEALQFLRKFYLNANCPQYNQYKAMNLRYPSKDDGDDGATLIMNKPISQDKLNIVIPLQINATIEND